MVDWLANPEVVTVMGFVFTSVLAPLAGDTVKDWLKDFFKGSFSSVLGDSDQKELKRIGRLALQDFLVLFQENLEVAGVERPELPRYEPALKTFTADPAVLAYLGAPLTGEDNTVEPVPCRDLWQSVAGDEPPLPDHFDWNGLARDYQRKLRVIRARYPRLRELLNAENLDAMAQHTRETAGVPAPFDTAAYAKALLDRYARLDLDLVEDTGVYYEVKLWSVFIPQSVRPCREYLPQYHELPKELQRRLRESGDIPGDLEPERLERFRAEYRELPTQSVLEAVRAPGNRCTVILGDPGAGKSTLLRLLALQWARKSAGERTGEPLPLLIELRRFAAWTAAATGEKLPAQDFIDYCHGGNIHCHLNRLQLDAELTAGRCLVLLDGLDEVLEPGRREAVTTAIFRLANRYPAARIIVTSRVLGYKARELENAGFRHYMLQDLEQGQMEDFLRLWHGVTYKENAEEGDRRRERLLEAVRASGSIRQLAGNPLLLTLMAIINRRQELPRDRVELYYQATRLLLHHWDLERQLRMPGVDPVAVDFRDKEDILRRVAYFMHGSEKGLAGNLISREDLEGIVRGVLEEQKTGGARELARRLIEQLRVRNFILCHMGGDWYAFVHRTFLEYFCAREIVRLYEKEQTLGFEQLRDDVFGAYWADESRHEVLRLVCGMLAPRFAGELIRFLMGRKGKRGDFTHLFLAADCLTEVRDRSGLEPLETALAGRMETLTRYDLWYEYKYFSIYYDKPNERVQAIRRRAAGALVGCARTAVAAVARLRELAEGHEDGDVRLWALEEWALFPDERNRVFALLLERAKGDEGVVGRVTALPTLGAQFPDRPETLPLLLKCAKEEKFDYARLTALPILGTHFLDRPETLPLLLERAQEDEHRIVRGIALSILGARFPDRPETLPLLLERAKGDAHWNVRQTVLSTLGARFPDRPETLPLLLKRAKGDEEGFVRGTALSTLGERFSGRPETLPLILERAKGDEEGYVRGTALSTLGEHFPDRPEILLLLLEHAKGDEHQYVRKIALSTLGAHFPDRPETLALLLEHAKGDKSEDVRGTALSTLGERFPDRPETLPLLLERAKGDEHADVRRTALFALGTHFPDRPETRLLLEDRAQNDLDEMVKAWAKESLDMWKKFDRMMKKVGSRQ